MRHPRHKPRHGFTDSARLKALETKRMKAMEDKDDAQVFIARDPLNSLRYKWEIRLFGGVVLERSETNFVDVGRAKHAGDAALASYRCPDRLGALSSGERRHSEPNDIRPNVATLRLG